jgi:hypothetical protein
MIMNKYLLFFAMFAQLTFQLNALDSNKYVIAVYFSQTDDLSKIILQSVSKYVDIKRATNIGIDMMCSPINEPSKAGVVCCAKNGVVVFEEKVNAASIVRLEKCKAKFDGIFELIAVPQKTRSTSDSTTELEGAKNTIELATDLALANNSRKE